MTSPWFQVPLVCILIAGASAQQKTLTSMFHNDRLKTVTLTDGPITGDINMRVVSGFWTAESSDPSKALVFPQQVKITCTHLGLNTCHELIITLAAAVGVVAVQDVDEEEYAIDSWDAHGLVASYGGSEGDSRCQRHVLTMDFDSGAVSVSDIPTHKKGCEMFKATDSYRLVRGNYYVDTSPGNDMDKPRK